MTVCLLKRLLLDFVLVAVMVLAELELGMVDGEVEGGVQAGVKLEVGVQHGRLIRVLPHLRTAKS